MAKPTAKFRAGPVSAAIWENDITVNGKKAVMLKASVERRYKDKDGQRWSECVWTMIATCRQQSRRVLEFFGNALNAHMRQETAPFLPL